MMRPPYLHALTYAVGSEATFYFLAKPYCGTIAY